MAKLVTLPLRSDGLFTLFCWWSEESESCIMFGLFKYLYLRMLEGQSGKRK